MPYRLKFYVFPGPRTTAPSRYKFLPPEIHFIIMELMDSSKDRYNLKRISREFLMSRSCEGLLIVFAFARGMKPKLIVSLFNCRNTSMLADCLRPCRECCQFLPTQRLAHEPLSPAASARRYTCIACGKMPKVNLILY